MKHKNKLNIKDNIWIEGFERKSSMYDRILQLGGEQNIIYKGKTSEASRNLLEELLAECYFCQSQVVHDVCRDEVIVCHEFNWSTCINVYKEFSKLCKQEYCIIYKK